MASRNSNCKTRNRERTAFAVWPNHFLDLQSNRTMTFESCHNPAPSASMRPVHCLTKSPRCASLRAMIPQRLLRIIPVALIMYTISYVDRTNVSLALDPKISSLMSDLHMDDRMKGQAAGIFSLGNSSTRHQNRPPAFR
jgi:hypothetical protein